MKNHRTCIAYCILCVTGMLLVGSGCQTFGGIDGDSQGPEGQSFVRADDQPRARGGMAKLHTQANTVYTFIGVIGVISNNIAYVTVWDSGYSFDILMSLNQFQNAAVNAANSWGVGTFVAVAATLPAYPTAGSFQPGDFGVLIDNGPNSELVGGQRWQECLANYVLGNGMNC